MAANEDLPTGTTQEAGSDAQTTPPIPEAVEASTQPAGEAPEAETPQEQQIVLSTPSPGEQVQIAVIPGVQILIDFDLGAQDLTATETDLIIEFDNGATITLTDFALYAAGDLPPVFILADGTLMPGDAIVFTYSGTAIEPAAGPELASGGSGEYRDDPGELIEGIDRLGTLDPDPLPAGPEAALEDEEIPFVPENGPPDALDDLAATDEDTPVTIGVLGNDSDPDGDPLTITDYTQPAQGSVTLNPDGSFTFDPGDDFNRLAAGESEDVTFSYTISDGNGGTDAAIVTITVNGANDGPIARDDAYDTDEDTELVVDDPNIGVLNRIDLGESVDDSDVDGDTLTVFAAGDAEGNLTELGADDTITFSTLNGGSVTLDSDGTYTYDPAEDFNGDDTFAYQVTDGNGGFDTATVTVTVNPVNDPPVVDLDGPEGDFNFENTFVEDAGAVNISDSDATISDVDSTLLKSMSVTLTNPQDGADESLSVDLTLAASLGITVTGDGTHSLTFTPTSGDTDAIGDFQALLRTVTYDNTSQDPDTTDRIINVQVTDDTDLTSNLAVSTISIQAENDTPIADPNKTVWVPDTNDSADVLGDPVYGYPLSISRPTDVDSDLTVEVTALPEDTVGTLYYQVGGDGAWTELDDDADIGTVLTLAELESLHFKATDDNADATGTFEYLVLEDGDGSSNVRQTVTLETVVPEVFVASADADETSPLTSGNPYEVNFPFTEVEADAFAGETTFNLKLYTDHDNPNDAVEDEMQVFLYVDIDGDATFLAGGDFGQDPTGTSNNFDARFLLTDFGDGGWVDSGLRTDGNGDLLDPEDPDFADGNIVWTIEVSSDDAIRVEGGDETLTEYLAANGGIDAGDNWQVLFNDDEPGNEQGRFARVDIIGGETERMTIDGTDEIDLIYGSDGNDTLNGNDGDDIIFGGPGNDQIDGGLGDDILTGGDGVDTFVFSGLGGEGTDTISDFTDGIDGDILKITDVLDLADAVTGVSDDGSDVTVTLNDVSGPDTVVVIEGIGNGNIDTLAELQAAINIETEDGL